MIVTVVVGVVVILALSVVTYVARKGVLMELQGLKDQVAAESTVIASAVVLLNGISARIDAAIAAAEAGDATALAELSASVKADTDSLSAAVAANTPAA